MRRSPLTAGHDGFRGLVENAEERDDPRGFAAVGKLGSLGPQLRNVEADSTAHLAYRRVFLEGIVDALERILDVDGEAVVVVFHRAFRARVREDASRGLEPSFGEFGVEDFFPLCAGCGVLFDRGYFTCDTAEDFIRGFFARKAVFLFEYLFANLLLPYPLCHCDNSTLDIAVLRTAVKCQACPTVVRATSRPSPLRGRLHSPVPARSPAPVRCIRPYRSSRAPRRRAKGYPQGDRSSW